MMFPILGPQQQQPILVTCSWSPWWGENCQLQPGRTAEWFLCPQLVPDKDSSVFGLFIPQLPILPCHQELQLPYVPDCVSQYLIYCISPLRPRLQKDPHFTYCFDVKSLLSNFSIQAFSSRKAFMDRERQRAVFTYFIKPFLSRNESSGKGRRSGSIW